tara:strand:+ start:1044 stop:1610 length:567 start_codon:yes stop_codon:yes gene_type:complete
MKKDAANGNGYAQDMVERYAARAKSRKCSYCGEGGHNKAGCAMRKRHGIIYQKTLNDFAENVTYRSATAGVKVGSLITITLRSGTKVTAIIEKIDINNRAPDYKWLNAHYKNHKAAQTEDELQHYEAYHRYLSSLKTALNNPSMLLRSLSGTGLGYWNDSETGAYEVCDILRNIEGTSGSNYEIVSVA